MGITAIVQKHNKIITDALLLFILAGSLQLTSNSLTEIDCFTFFTVILLISIPVHLSIRELPLLKHRLFIERTWHHESFVHKLFWKATVKRISLYLISVLMTLSMIFTTSLFDTSHWVIIYIDILVILVLRKLVSENVMSQVNSNHTGLVARNYFLNGINLFFLVIVIFCLDFFFSEVTDTRGKDPWILFEQQLEIINTSTCHLASFPYAFVKGVDSLIWHFMQVGVIRLQDDATQFIAWLLFLIPIAFSAAIIQHVFLGGLLLSEIKHEKNLKLLGDSLFSKSFMITIIFLATIYFYAVYIISNTDFSELEKKAKITIDQIDPCAKPDKILISQHMEYVNNTIKTRSEVIKLKSHARVDKQFDDMKRKSEKSIDVYLDWLFSVVGEYERLSMVFTGDVAMKMSNHLVKVIFLDTGISKDINHLVRQEHKNNQTILLDMAETITMESSQFTSNNPCLLREVELSTPSITRDKITASTATITGAIGTRVAGKALGQKTASMAAAKIVNKAGFKTVINIIGKALTKKAVTSAGGGVVSGAAAGLICGPGSPVCSVVGGIVGGLATWLIVDKVFIEIDEAINRDELRKEMIESVHAQLLITQNELNKDINKNIDRMIQVIQNVHKQEFNPSKDGIGN